MKFFLLLPSHENRIKPESPFLVHFLTINFCKNAMCLMCACICHTTSSDMKMYTRNTCLELPLDLGWFGTMWWWLRLGPKRLGNLSLSINVFTNMRVSMTESRLQLSMCFCACVFVCETNTVHHSYITQWRLVSFSWLKFRNKLVVTSALIHFCIAFIYLFLYLFVAWPSLSSFPHYMMHSSFQLPLPLSLPSFVWLYSHFSSCQLMVQCSEAL